MEEYKKIEKEIEEDKRTIKQLFVDRYGAVPMTNRIQVQKERLDAMVYHAKGLVILEVVLIAPIFV